MRVLIVEDDKVVAEYISKGLKESGHVYRHISDGRDALFTAITETFDVIVLDRMLPSLDGLSILQTLRASDNTTPILILSALSEIDDRVKGLKAGGDDYLVKPFAFSELLARLEVLVRRPLNASVENVLRIADLEMDTLTRRVTRENKTIDLQPREFQLLAFFMQHQDQVLTRTMLFEHVWDYHFDPTSNVIDVHISRLRQKIDKGFSKALLHTIRGAGYVLRSSE